MPINQHWENLAQKNKKVMTSPDLNIDLLERESIKKYLKGNHSILDIGSGDGIATLDFAKKVKKADGLEVSPTLLEIAKKNQKKSKTKNIEWFRGSILNLDKLFLRKNHDIFITKRVLINLASWDEQQQAIGLVAKLCNKGDYFLAAEGFVDNFNNLQELRAEFGVGTYNIVKFNLYLDRQKFEKYCQKYFEIVEQNNFGIYYFISHFLHPLIIKPKEPQFKAKINAVAAQIALKKKLLEEFGYINFYALRRK